MHLSLLSKSVFVEIVFVSIAVLTVVLPASPASAQRSTHAEKAVYEYAAKVICGRQSDQHDLKLVRGDYTTAINIRNPGREPVKFEKSLALTFPPDEQKAGDVLPISTDELGPGEALAVDCQDIKVHLFPYGYPRDLIKGFLVVRSPVSLDVTAVYSASAAPRRKCCHDDCCGGRDCCKTQRPAAPSIDVETVPERVIGTPESEKRPDLIPQAPYPPGDPVGEPGTGFCAKPTEGRFSRSIEVIIRNAGDGPAGLSQTSVAFDPGSTQQKPTPALAPGETATLDFAMPTVCIGLGRCEFKIIADTDDTVAESLETNNTAMGVCRTHRGPG